MERKDFWTKVFFTYIALDYSLYDCISFADNALREFDERFKKVD